MAGAKRPRLSDALLASVPGTRRGVVSVTEAGVIAGLKLLDAAAEAAPVGSLALRATEGVHVEAGQVIVEIHGSGAELSRAEDTVLGPVGFASGVATRCQRIVASAPAGMRIVCGGWKKLPAALKPLLRAGLAAGGVAPRLLDGDFLYVDKNSVRLLGGVLEAVAAGRALGVGPVAIQAKTVEIAVAAARQGAGAIMVDSASIEVLSDVHHALAGAGLRSRVVLAFGGGVKSDRLSEIAAAGAQVVDIGREILDAPLLDLRFDVLASGDSA